MLFKEKDIELIRKGIKTEDIRRWKKPNVEVDKIYPVKSELNFFREPEIFIKILGIKKEKLGNISSEEASKEGFYDVREFHRKWIMEHKHWNPNEEVYIISFSKILEVKSISTEEKKHEIRE